MYTLVLIRHGESIWNRENRFTGWRDIDLSPQGIVEARSAGRVPVSRVLSLTLHTLQF